ncbi:MAG: protein translocase subunit SecD [Bdellovibrionota bacterium]
MPTHVRNWAIFIFLLVAGSVAILAAKPIVLGLDLQGGIHLVLEINDQDIVTHELKTSHQNIVERLKEKKLPEPTASAYEEESLVLTFADEAQRDQAMSEINNYFSGFAQIASEDIKIRVQLQRTYLNEIKKRSIQQTMETIDRRINESGIAEPSITRQGYNKIVVQLAGVTTSLDLKNIIEKTAVLKFKLVESYAADKELLLKPHDGKVPDNLELYPQMDEEEGTKEVGWYLVQKFPEVDGTLLEDAVTIHDERGLPAVSFTFNAEGAEQFGKVTRENLKKQLAIVLDDQVKSAPVIQSEIRRSGQITGSFTLSEAQALSIVLRSGPLPVKLHVAEERLVGPSLGHDSIQQGFVSSVVGAILTVLFMVVYYRIGGFFADIALTLNILFVFAFLAMFGAVLTLPGIAGIALTIGMAVDSNVLIFERMREELLSGKTVRAAVDAGYSRAMVTIIDSNLTTLITGLVLFVFGTGPIKGFAVTLNIGLLSSLFTSVIVTRLFYDHLTATRRLQTLSI